MERRLVSMPGRRLGRTESNWCRAVEEGTGITVIGLLFAKQVEECVAKAALESLVREQPLLRAEVHDRDGNLCFVICDTPNPTLEVIHSTSCSTSLPPPHQKNAQEAGSERWLLIVEDEMNKPFPKQKPFKVFHSLLYKLPQDHTLLIMRVHAAACDLASSGPMCSHILKFMEGLCEAEKHGRSLCEFVESRITDSVETVVRVDLPAVESSVPKEKSGKPLWAHGFDMLGYGLASRKHSYLPLEDTGVPRQSRLMRSFFGRDCTKELIDGCSKNGSNLFGALTAACMKAVAEFKKLGDRGEHYGSTILLNCRKLLEPEISPSLVGFYHSAMLKTFYVKESLAFWELARRCTDEVEEAIKNGKHFMDMGDLNTLMVQAMNFPNLTPSGSLRTSLLSLYYDPILEVFTDAAASLLRLKDYVTCSSISGVGPCIALFPFLRNGCLHISYIYCSPLFSESHIHTIVDRIEVLLTECC